VAGARPLLVLTEWHAALGREKQPGEVKETPRSKRKNSTTVTTRPGSASMLVFALAPVMEVVASKGGLQAGDVTHRAVLGQVVAALVEEMVGREEERMQVVAREILVGLAKGYMDKVMDVLLVHYQPSIAGTVQPSVVATLASLAYTHPHGTVPFLKVRSCVGLWEGFHRSDGSLSLLCVAPIWYSVPMNPYQTLAVLV
jgi:hypothetical protein